MTREQQRDAITKADAAVFAAADLLAEKVRARHALAKRISKATYVAARDGHRTSNLRTGTNDAISRGLARSFEASSQLRFAKNLASYLREIGVISRGRVR